MPTRIALPTGSAPARPPTGTVLLYADSGGDLHVLESDGTDTELGAGGGGAVSSVFGRTGAVVAATSDYDATQIDISATSRILGRVSGGAGQVEELTGVQAATIIAAATTSAQGAVELATSAETETGTDANRAVTPSGGAATYVKRSLIDAAGDLVVGTAADTPGRLAIGAEGQVLGVSGGSVAWVSLAVALSTSAAVEIDVADQSDLSSIDTVEGSLS